MFYIEENEKPNRIERKINILKVKENTIELPDIENKNEKQIEKISKKTKRILEKCSHSKKVVLSKKTKENELYINYLNTYGIEISDGRWLFKILIPEVIEYIVKKQKIENVKISLLINDLTEIEIENIKELSRKYKTINIVTNHIEKFKNIAKILESEGIIITITNNKKKSLMKNDIIINIDFPKELINKYRIKEDAIIINIRGKIKINQKRFNGLNVNDYEIDCKEDKKENKFLTR